MSHYNKVNLLRRTSKTIYNCRIDIYHIIYDNKQNKVVNIGVIEN